MKRIARVAAGLVLAVVSMASTAMAALDHEAYVWQRVWAPAHATVLAASHDLLAGWRVLAAQWHPDEGLVRARVDLAVLRADARPVVAVLRVDGSTARVDAVALGDELERIVQAWREAGVTLAGIEIDHDAPSSQLAAYAFVLEALHARLPPGLALSITTLPAWTPEAAFAGVLARVDAAVLQLHAVDAPTLGLFDATRARARLEAFAAVAHVPYRIALPAYGAGLVRSADGVLVESEATLARGGGRVEIEADPREVAAFLRKVERAPPRGLVGIAWFRLPLPADRRAWSLATLRAVIDSAPLAARVSASLAGQGGARDVVVRNDGTLAASLPRTLRIDGPCEAADALTGYVLQRSPATLRFSRTADAARLAAGDARTIGWVRCTTKDEVHVAIEHED